MLPERRAAVLTRSFGGTHAMWRFIFIGFAFLAFVFYEMSGGANFNAEELRLSRVDGMPAVETKDPETTQIAQTPRAEPENVTRVSLNLTTVNDVLRPTNLRTQRAKVTARNDEAEEVEQTVSETEPLVILPSLIMDSSAITPVTFGENREAQQIAAIAATATATGDFDIRSVSGNSVNVRGGPGTSYSVVNRLVRGDKVEILQDPGHGWVQLLQVGGVPSGGMADFLLDDG